MVSIQFLLSFVQILPKKTTQRNITRLEFAAIFFATGIFLVLSARALAMSQHANERGNADKNAIDKVGDW